MANNHEQFIAFHGTITASNTKRQTLKKNRDAIRTKIRNHFKEHWPKKTQPKFHWQGSYSMYTLLNPIKDEEGLGAYDLDDGVYFIGSSEEERENVQWYHDEIYKAVKDHTSEGAKDNAPCVTAYYADNHHVDLPAYFMVDGDKHPKMAHKKNPWMDTDPRETTNWFNRKTEHPQLRRIVRYVKAWADYVNNQGKGKMPTGCILTILVVDNYTANKRDDIALKDVLVKMNKNLNADNGFHCYRPTFPKNEDLFEHYKESRKNFFLKELKSFANDAEKAINTSNQKDGCLKWQNHFGERFSCSTAKDEEEDAQKKELSGTLKNNSRFA